MESSYSTSQVFPFSVFFRTRTRTRTRTAVAAVIFSALAGSIAAPAVHAAVPVKHPAAKTAAAATAVVNINTADVAALCTLKGIGPAKAQAIIAYRKQHGPFKSAEQLAEVKNIGAATIAKNRQRIAVH